MLKSIIGYFSNDLSIDLGTANTLVYAMAYTSVLAVPRSIERSFEKYPIILFNISYLKKN